ncbi:MAG: ABC transporter permease [Actinobacteria bacterium BACL15 MAG-120619-bin91]|jgi:general nucleoside transport system permease protein|uniref:ABC transporter permease n=1 Tax=Actinobacteria bacterium BACL15 MAG-120619-bin91 TaxID=1655562 RepID=A0A0R2PF52_9ACTN|nr:MAG: ABC transporter permease [Actinobacteria bacterium BACL15 MAG-120619-bin91]
MKAMKILRYATMLVFVLASIRVITGASDLTSTGTASAALLLSVPIVLAALGGLFSERAGVVNIGLEGMMIMGAWAGGYIGSQHGPWFGLMAAMIFGSVGALVHAIATVTFGVDHVVSGVAINIIAAGLVRYLSTLMYKNGSWPGPSQSPGIETIPLNGLPVLSGGQYFGWKSPDLLGSIANLNWFFVSDIASILRGLTGDVSYVTVVAISFVPLAYFILWRTAFGLRLRSAGEAPVAAESLGVNVYAMKYAGVLISGGLAGLGGGFLAIVAASNYQENQVAGRGYIGLAALLFGNYRPGGLLAGAGLFGFADALQLRDSAAIHALLLLIVVILAFVAFRKFKSGKQIGGLLALTAAGFTLWFYFAVDELPGQLVTMTPYIATLLVMALASQRLRMPAADGMPYRRGGLR